ncbi:MAG: hypothetical protein M1297_02315 [Nitrospirae bacterium]|nr:hypothetical protein [Nitrospirota bacterium]
MSQRKIDNNIQLSQFEDYLLSTEFSNALIHDDGRAAQQHLAAGRPIYYEDPHYPEGLIKKYPNGHRQIVTMDPEGRICVVRDL